MISITSKENCTGCYACVNICPVASITMETDSEGFWYPVVDDCTCTQCGLCTIACPIAQRTTGENTEESMPEAYAAYSTHEELRLQSSSGGLFSLLAETVIDDGGVVFGARFDGDFNVVHDYVENTKHLFKMRGSKYVQSRIGDTYKQAEEFLKHGRLVMYSGTPCQIGGLKGYLGRDYENLVCQDIICHGVPSPKVWQKYVAHRENYAGSKARRIAFRRKDEGWKRYSVSFWFENDTEYVETLRTDLYMQAFLKNICLRPSCHACHFKTMHRESDITLADFWGIQHMMPAMDDDKGTSLVLLHTEQGHQLFRGLHNKIEVCSVNPSEAMRYNSAMVKSVKMHPSREAFFLSLDDERIDVLMEQYCRDKLHVRLMKKLKLEVCRILERLGLLDTSRKVLTRYRG